MKFEFKPSDFDLDSYERQEEAAAQADIALQSHLENLPMVYGREGHDGWFTTEPLDTIQNHAIKTHRAILFNIEEVSKKCEHVPDMSRPEYSINTGGGFRHKYRRCLKCGTKLQAKWEVIK